MVLEQSDGEEQNRRVNFFQAPRRNCHCQGAGNLPATKSENLALKRFLIPESPTTGTTVSGHKSLKILDNYAVASHQQQSIVGV